MSVHKARTQPTPRRKTDHDPVPDLPVAPPMPHEMIAPRRDDPDPPIAPVVEPPAGGGFGHE